MRRILPSLLLILCALFTHPGISSQELKPIATLSSFRLSEQVIDFAFSRSTINKCIIVAPDGRFHVEERNQQLPSETADIKIFEGTLSQTQAGSLQAILNDSSLINAKDFPIPSVPVSNDYLRAVTVKIQRGHLVQNIAFANWSNQTVAYDGATQELVDRQKQAEKIVKPLIDWFHALQAVKLTEVTAQANLCGY